jgi:hypothetical protein
MRCMSTGGTRVERRITNRRNGCRRHVEDDGHDRVQVGEHEPGRDRVREERHDEEDEPIGEDHVDELGALAAADPARRRELITGEEHDERVEAHRVHERGRENLVLCLDDYARAQDGVPLGGEEDAVEEERPLTEHEYDERPHDVPALFPHGHRAQRKVHARKADDRVADKLVEEVERLAVDLRVHVQRDGDPDHRAEQRVPVRKVEDLHTCAT